MEKIAVCADSMLYATGMLDCGGVFMIQADPTKTTGPWHFIDIPVRASATASAVMRHCPHGRDCVVAQILRQSSILGDARSTLERKRLALMFLIHFMGDIHQPLHCADDKDGGGNKKKLVFHGQRKNLHSLWDDMIMAEGWQVQAMMDPVPLAAELEGAIRQRDVSPWIRGDFVREAMRESHEIAKDRIYPQYAEDHGQDLGDAYRDAMQPVAKQRLAMAGVRLAALLERVLGTIPLSDAGQPAVAKESIR